MIIEELQNCIWRVASINLGFDGCKCSFTWQRIAEPVKWIFAMVKSLIYTSEKHSSNTILLFLFLSKTKNISIGLKKRFNNEKKLKCSERLVYDFGTSLVQTHFYQTHITGGRFMVRSQWTYLYCSFSSCKGSNDSGLTHECQYFCYLFH